LFSAIVASMVPARRGVIVALIIGSIVGGTAGATIVTAASHTTHERVENAQRAGGGAGGHQIHDSSSAT
jgi:hypothetical protein